MNVSMTVSNIIILRLHVNKIPVLEKTNKQTNKKILTEEKDSNRTLKLTLWLDWPNKLLWTRSLIPNTTSSSLLWFLLDYPKPC